MLDTPQLEALVTNNKIQHLMKNNYIQMDKISVSANEEKVKD